LGPSGHLLPSSGVKPFLDKTLGPHALELE
jgi:hypothetical protein